MPNNDFTDQAVALRLLDGPLSAAIGNKRPSQILIDSACLILSHVLKFCSLATAFLAQALHSHVGQLVHIEYWLQLLAEHE